MLDSDLVDGDPSFASRSRARPRIGLATPQMRFTLDEIAFLWSHAEAAGIESLWLSDHLTSTGMPFTRAPFDAWTALLYLARLAPACRAGILVSAVTFRAPVPQALLRLADTAFASLGARLRVGIGAGWCRDEHDFCDLAFPAIGDRMRQLAEQAAALRAHLDRQAVGLGSRPRFIIGGLGSRTVGIAARWADGWNGVGPPEVIAERRALLYRLCAEANRDATALEVSATMRVAPCKSDAEAEEQLQLWASAHHRTVQAVRRDICAGPSEVIAAELVRYAAAGVDQVILQPVAPSQPDARPEPPAVLLARLALAIRIYEEQAERPLAV